MQKPYLSITIIIAMLFSVILLPTLAYGKQQQQRQDLFPTATATTSKSETNNDVQSESTSRTLSSHDKKGQNDNADVNYNDNVDTNDNGDDNAADAKDSNNNDVDVNNPSGYRPIILFQFVTKSLLLVLFWPSITNYIPYSI
jgi:uncharacterized protein YxeA